MTLYLLKVYGNDYSALQAENFGIEKVFNITHHYDIDEFEATINGEHYDFYTTLDAYSFTFGNDAEEAIRMCGNFKELIDYDTTKRTNIFIFNKEDIKDPNDYKELAKKFGYEEDEESEEEETY